MQRGFAFKLMKPKDIAGVLAMIGVHPAVNHENIDKPTTETASSMYQQLAEFAYDMDIQQIKARASEVQGVGQYMEIFDEAMDAISIFKLARELAFINRVEDFNMKDIWDPQPKRVRAVLSGMINFCRYKESQTNVITNLKQEVQALDNVRLELVDKTNTMGHELAEAQAQHSAELQDMWAAENEMQEANNIVDKLQKQKQAADRLFETADTKLESAKERLARNEQRADQLRENISSLQEQVAESPEGLAQEVQELQLAIRQQKARVEEKGDEKRARALRVQALRGLFNNIDKYKESLDKVANVAAAEEAARDRTRAARNELTAMRSTLDARHREELDLGQAVEQVTEDMETAKQAHEGHVQEYEQRSQQARAKQEELQGKRSEEQHQWSVLQAQRAELEAEIAGVRRAHEAEKNDFEMHLRAMQEEGGIYVQTIDGLITHSLSSEALSRLSSKSPSRLSSKSPRSGRSSKSPSRRNSFDIPSCSPSLRASPAPRRLLMERSGY